MHNNQSPFFQHSDSLLTNNSNFPRSRMLYNEGLLYWKEGKQKEAMESLTRSLTQDRYLVISHLLLARIKEDSDRQGSMQSLAAAIGAMRQNSKINYTQIGLPETVYLADLLLLLARLFYEDGRPGEAIHSLLLAFPHKQLPRHHLLIDEAFRNPTDTLTEEMKLSIQKEDYLFKRPFEPPLSSDKMAAAIRCEKQSSNPQPNNKPTITSSKTENIIFKISFTDPSKPKRILQWKCSINDPTLLPSLKTKAACPFLYYKDEDDDLISITDPEDLPLLFGDLICSPSGFPPSISGSFNSCSSYTNSDNGNNNQTISSNKNISNSQNISSQPPSAPKEPVHINLIAKED